MTVFHIDTALTFFLKVIINRDSLQTLSQVYNSLTNGFSEKHPIEPIEKLYTINGQLVQAVEDLWGSTETFIAASSGHVNLKELQNLIHNIFKSKNINEREEYIDPLTRHQNFKMKPLKSIIKNKTIESMDPSDPNESDEKFPSIYPSSTPDILIRPDKVAKYNYNYLKDQNNDILKRNENMNLFHDKPQSQKIRNDNDYYLPTIFNSISHPNNIYGIYQNPNLYSNYNYPAPQLIDPSILNQNEIVRVVPKIDRSKEVVHHVSYKEKYPEIEERYSIEKAIGSGRHCKVYRGKDKRGDCELVAIKVINREVLPEKCESPYEELSILEKLDHENLIVLLNHIDSNRRLILVFELAEKGDLFQLLKERGPMSEIQAASVINDIGAALFYLHNNQIIHRNVKLENILIFRITHYHVFTKLADFSLAIKVVDPISIVCGSINYISPEMANRQDYMYSVDIWALGVVSYILLSALPPFYSIDGKKEEILDRIRNCDYTYPIGFWAHVSKECKEFIDSLLQHDPNKRLTAEELLCHKWSVSNGNITDLNSENINEFIRRRKDKLNRVSNVNSTEKTVETEPKNKGVLDKIKSFFKSSEEERIKSFLEPGRLRIHRKSIKLPSTNTDPKDLFD